MLKIDMHVHPLLRRTAPNPDGTNHLTVEELFGVYERCGVEKGVALPLVAPECGVFPDTNEMAMEIHERFPDRFEWFMNIDPRWIWNRPDTDFSYLIEYYKERGAKGIGEMTTNLAMDDPRVMNLMRHCEKARVPMTIHLGNPGYGDYGLIDDMGLPLLENALATFPKLIIIGHSQKFWAEISGDLTRAQRDGYPSGHVAQGGRLIELFRKYPNLHADLSAGSGYNALTRDAEFGCRFLDEFSDRLYYATDICAPWNETLPFMGLSKWLDDMREAGNIRKDTYESVSRGNALRLFQGII